MTHPPRPLLFDSPADCEQAFYEALEAGDAQAVADLWLNDEEVCCIHPGGPRLQGPVAVRASWAALLAQGGLHLRVTAAKALETPTVAVHTLIENLLVTQAGRQCVTHSIVTHVYVKTTAGWKMRLHHASAAAGEDADGTSASHGPLH